MPVLPDLHRALVAAGGADPKAREVPKRSPPKRRRTVLLAAGLVVTMSAGAYAAADLLLADGDAVPESAAPDQLSPQPRGDYRLLAARAPDPDGGPSWAIATYEAQVDGKRTLTCATVARTQNAALGVVGRDGIFRDDGRFHALSPRVQTAVFCGSRLRPSFAQGPPVPASGYTGRPGPPLGGCREDVDLNGPTVSPQTRKRLRNVPVCAAGSRRVVIAGLAPLDVKRVLVDGPEARRAVTVAPDGSFLVVARPDELGTTRPAVDYELRSGRRRPPLEAQRP